jgi:hypothetical protein
MIRIILRLDADELNIMEKASAVVCTVDNEFA